MSLIVRLDRNNIFPPLLNNPESFLSPTDNLQIYRFDDQKEVQTRSLSVEEMFMIIFRRLERNILKKLLKIRKINRIKRFSSVRKEDSFTLLFKISLFTFSNTIN